MQLVNEFTVNLPIEKAWALLTDVPIISHCMPGAKITSANGDNYKGEIKLKVGPISSTFGGSATVERYPAQYVAVITVDGRDTKANGFAKGTITATIVSDGPNRSKVRFDTDVTLSGRMASFGRQVMADISNKLFMQFAECVESDLNA